MRRKIKKPKSRNPYVLPMSLSRKPGAHKDKRKKKLEKIIKEDLKYGSLEYDLEMNEW